ncbi:MAG: hypothetical protein HN564_03670, partial [Flavobacteriales bacterium]|nr:hypothetical protein [Flavobacteriales bacterium]
STGTAKGYRAVEGWVDSPNNTPVRNNGNNVDIEKEVMNMKENAMLYQIYSELYNRKSASVKKAIRGS